MKSQVQTRKNRMHYSHVSFPNSATATYRRNKIIDYLLTIATTIGIVVAILFLMTL